MNIVFLLNFIFFQTTFSNTSCEKCNNIIYGVDNKFKVNNSGIYHSNELEFIYCLSNSKFICNDLESCEFNARKCYNNIDTKDILKYYLGLCRSFNYGYYDVVSVLKKNINTIYDDILNNNLNSTCKNLELCL